MVHTVGETEEPRKKGHAVEVQLATFLQTIKINSDQVDGPENKAMQLL